MFEGVQGAETKQALGVGLAFALVFLALVCGGCWMAVGEDVSGVVGPLWRGERDLSGQAVYTPAHPFDGEALAAVDLEAVHAKLLPSWSVALGWRSSEGGEARYQAARAALLDALVAEPNLDALAAELVRRAEQDPWGSADRLGWIAWAWGHYLDTHGQPWRFDVQVLRNDERDLFYTKSYRVDGEGQVRVGERPVRIRWIRRVDDTNVVERYDGVVKWPEDGGFLLVDRLRESATEVVWPALAGSSAAVPHGDAFRESLRSELSAGLPAEALALLESTAPIRAAMLADVAAIRERASCGSRFVIPLVPNLGFDQRSLDALTRAARRAGGGRCPQVTIEEAERLALAAEHFAGTPRLEEAIAALSAWVARGIAVHEARHVADALSFGDLERPIPCAACEGALGASSRAELSAYLATFAHAEHGASSLLLACAAGERGPHGAARAWLVARDPIFACERGYSAETSASAARWEQEIFGRSEPAQVMGLPGALPAAP